MSATDLAFPRRFGTQLRALRLARCLSQADLAGPVIARSMVAKLEAGTRWPSLHAIEHLAHALQVTPRALFPPGT